MPPQLALTTNKLDVRYKDRADNSIKATDQESLGVKRDTHLEIRKQCVICKLSAYISHTTVFGNRPTVSHIILGVYVMTYNYVYSNHRLKLIYFIWGYFFLNVVVAVAVVVVGLVV